MPSIRRVAIATLVGAIAVLHCGAASAEEKLRPCTYKVENENSLRDTADALRADAFADAYDAYLRDIAMLQAEFDGLLADAVEYAEGRCRVFTEAVAQLETDIARYKASGCEQGVTPEQLPECQYQYEQLERRRGIMIERERENRAVEADLGRRNADLEARQVPALERAALVLDPDHVEDALRLYISWLQRNSTGTSCGDFARIADRLGVRVQNQKYYLGLLARNLVPHPNELWVLFKTPALTPFTFHATGFKPEFRTADLNDNQVRHAMAYVITGYTFRGSGNKLIAKFRDELQGQPEDYRLGVEAGYMGFQLKTGTYGTTSFGRAIESRLCE